MAGDPDVERATSRREGDQPVADWRRRFFDPWRLGEETKPFFLTSEFWVGVLTVVALLVATSADNYDAPRAWTLVAVVASAYIVSRGLAKAGSRHFRRDD
jgi:hypothetical protein